MEILALRALADQLDEKAKVLQPRYEAAWAAYTHAMRKWMGTKEYNMARHIRENPFMTKEILDEGELCWRAWSLQGAASHLRSAAYTMERECI